MRSMGQMFQSVSVYLKKLNKTAIDCMPVNIVYSSENIVIFFVKIRKQQSALKKVVILNRHVRTSKKSRVAQAWLLL